MANYPVDRRVLQPYLPAHTELDEWKGEAYVSLVGFMFHRVRVKGVSIPYHTDFPEVNLRFYVRYKENNDWKRGVVFISEIVPKPAITWIANTLFKEHYRTLPMRHATIVEAEELCVAYRWRYRGRWNELEVKAAAQPAPIEEGCKAEFITEHYWGYSAMGPAVCGEYQVAHPRWNTYAVRDYRIDCDFSGLYGKSFAGLEKQEPASVFLAEGSAIEVFSKRIIKKIIPAPSISA